MTTITVNLGSRSYDIVIGHGLIKQADKILNLNRKLFIVTDSGVPKNYSECIKGLSSDAMIFTVPSGEDSKSMSTLTGLLEEMSRFGMTRRDAVIAVGGGVVGDLAGFAASVYMRGIDFYNVPTTVLSQVDSSIGGKTAVNLGGIKNIVGAFHQPKAVIIDIETLTTLPKRQIVQGLAEAVKMAVTSDEKLFEVFEKSKYDEIISNIESVIIPSLLIKKSVVEKDEEEKDIRKVLNFGHTLGHAIESLEGLRGLYHGECVAIGMLPMCGSGIRERVRAVLNKLSLPTEYKEFNETTMELIGHDKKRSADKIAVVLSEKIGTYKIQNMGLSEIYELIEKAKLGG